MYTLIKSIRNEAQLSCLPTSVFSSVVDAASFLHAIIYNYKSIQCPATLLRLITHSAK